MRRTPPTLILFMIIVLLAGGLPGAPVLANSAYVPLEGTSVALALPSSGVVPTLASTTPAAVPQRPSLSLGLLVSPDLIGIGDTASITITVDNRNAIAATNLVVTLPTPDGAVALPGPGWLGVNRGWRWDLGTFAGPSTVLTASLQLASLPTANVLLLRARATAGNVPGPITARGGATVIDRSLGPVTTAFTPGVAAQLRSRDGRVSVQFPGAGAARPLTLRFGHEPLPGKRRPWKRVNGRTGLAPIFLDATDAQQNEIHQFTAPLTLTVSYTPEQLQALDIGEGDLTLFWFDEAQDLWVPLPTTIDSAAHTVSAQVDHFSAFQLSDGSSPSKAYLPSLEGFQVSSFTGAASNQIPIDVPAGPGGLKPALSLNYSSSASDGRGGERAKWQAGWAGKGWSLEAGSVSLDHSTAGSDWNHFSFTFGGQAFDVVRGPMTGAPINSRTGADYSNDQPFLECWQWHSADENFARVRAIPLQATATTSATVQWQAWTKDGIRYDFAQPLWWAWHNDGGSNSHEAYKWLLTSVTDTHGNRISYTYHVDSVTISIASGQPTVLAHPTWYLQSINWGYDGATPGTGTPRYQASFEVADRTVITPTQGVDASWEFFDSTVSQTWKPSTPHEIYRLDKINITSMLPSAGTYQLIRQYRLNYSPSGSSIRTDDYTAGDLTTYQPVLTLMNVQQYGRDGTTTLPKRMFTYGTNPGSGDTRPPEYNRLTMIQNSEGGQLSFAYEHAFAKAGLPAGECWCNYRNYNRVLQTLTQDTSGQSYAKSALTTYDYTNGGQNTAAVNDEHHAATVVFAHYPPSGNGDSRQFLARLEKTEFRGHWYMAEKHYDGGTTGMPLLQEVRHWFYQGNGGSANAVCDPHRHSVGSGKDALDASELDPTGNPNSCFQQMLRSEAFKGREYQTEIRDNAGVLILQTLHNFTRQDLPFFGSDPGFFNSTSAFEIQSNNYKRNGLWRAFVFENQTTENSFEGGSLVRPKTTKYFYNPACDPVGVVDTYGNMGCTQELNATGGTFRTTKRWFNNRNDGLTGSVWGPFIVDRMWQQATYDDLGKLSALTNQFYDGNNTVANTIGTKGELTRVAKYYDAPRAAIGSSNTILPSGTIHGNDMSYTHDVYGNQASATSYAGSGTRTDNGSGGMTWSLPGTSSHARTTTTAYDGIFHSFPMTATNALGQAEHADYDFQIGTLIRVSGLNMTGTATNCHLSSFSISATEETTCAKYDAFGRMVALIKPGESTTTPSVQAIYHDTVATPTLPIQYEVKRRDTSTDGMRETQQFYDGQGRQIQTKAESQDNAQNIVTDMVYDGLNRLVQQSQPHYTLPESGAAFTSYTAPGTLTNPTATSYDALGRVSTVLTPDGQQTSHFYLVWNDNGVPRVAHNVVDAKRHRTKSSTDVASRLIKVEEISGNCGQFGFLCTGAYTSTWALYATTNYTYTALDQLGGVTDTNSNHTVNYADSLGRNTQTFDPDLGSWAYAYDANSNLLSQTDARGKRICFFYDDLDRLTAKHYQDNTSACPASAPNSANDVTYSYDQNPQGTGHRTAMAIVGGATTAWTYDARGRKLTELYSTVPGLAAGQTRQFTWTYDAADRVATLAYPATASAPLDTVTYAYDAAWRQTNLTSSRGVPATLASASQPATALDQPSQWTFGNGAIQTWSYTSPMQRVARIQATSGASTVLDHSYGYDYVGNVAAISDTVNLPAVQAFDYDHRDRLIHTGPLHASGLGMAALFGAPTTTDSVVTGMPATATSALAFELRMPGDDVLATGDVPPAPTIPTPAAPAPSTATPAAASAPAAATRPDFGRLPLAFVPNQGQTDAQARFLVHGAGGTLFFAPGEAVLTLPDPSDTVTTTVVRLRYVGANASPTITARNALPGVVNYMTGGDSTKWRTNVPTYAGISYSALYSGIDLNYDGTDGKLKSTYVVAPNADPSQIRWRYLGARDLQVDASTGDLIITMGGPRRGRILTEHAPLAWQDLNGTRVPVSARFDVAQNGSVGFALGSYEHSQPLTIDPILTYSTYHGGNRDEKATAIVVDGSGQAIMAGYTTSNTAFPLQGALYSSYIGNTDAFVSKFNAAGNALLFSTYLGGSNEDKANAITLDPSGNIVIAGETESGGAGATLFPTVGAMDSSFASGGPCTGGHCKDVFLSKLNAAGSSLLYSTFFGGTGVEEANGVAADSGAIYATGIVTATGMSTLNYYDNLFNGPTDAFVIKVNPATSGSGGLLYSTFLGGSSDDEGHALALGSSGKVYITGDTKSSNYPTKTPYQPSNAGGQDAFVTAINTTLSGANSLLYSTYLGGSATDEGDGIVLDASSNAYITGSTTSSAYPTKTAWQSTIAGDHDAILTELNPAAATGATSLLYSTYLGGIRDDRGQAIARDSSGVLYLTGYTNSITYPTTLAVQPTFGGGTCGAISCTDVFVTAFNITANAPVYSTFLGNNQNDQGLAIAADSSGAAYVAGYTDGTFPTSVSPRQAASGGQRDAFVAKLSQPTATLGAATVNVAENASPLNLAVTLSAASPVTVTVDYTTANGTATAGSDYTAQSGTLTFAPGVTTQTISVPIVGDLSDEPNETFSVTLSGPYGARLGATPSTTVTITDDDAPPSVSWQGANTNVNEAAGSALVPVVLTAPSAFTITVVYATSNGTATAGSDYTTSSGTLTFAPSQTSLNVSIPITNDAVVEPNETVNLTLSSPTNATISGTNPATLTIVDNDGGATGGDEFYQYDALGDLLQKGATAYTYGASASSCVSGTPASKPHAAVTAGAASYTYDCDGNMLSGGTRTSMLWDTENRLTSVTNSGVTETYGYDADGERITRTSAGVTTVYLGGLWEETSAGAVKQYYPFNGTVVAVRDSSAGVSYLHADHLGSVSVSSGAQAGNQTFGPWGNVTSGSSSATARNYTGQYLDSASGLLYYHARYYDATLARFISADTVVPGQTDKTGAPNPQQLNRYSYVTNNPLTSNDPTGHEAGCGMGGGEECGGGGYDPTEGVERPHAPERIAEPVAEPVVEPVVEPVEAVPPTTQMGPEAAGEAGAEAASVKPGNNGFSSGKPPHVAEVTVNRGGEEVYSGTFRSGGMTPEEAELGFPRSSLATHTEARAVRQVPLQAGDEMLIRGQYEPCRTCKGAMNNAARTSGANITYTWEDQVWIAGGKK